MSENLSISMRRKKNYLEAPPARSIRLDLFGGDPGEEGRRPGDRCRWGGG
jgi:hypothetical protein